MIPKSIKRSGFIVRLLVGAVLFLAGIKHATSTDASAGSNEGPQVVTASLINASTK